MDSGITVGADEPLKAYRVYYKPKDRSYQMGTVEGVNLSKVTEKQLPGIFGKDIAEKIVKGKGDSVKNEEILAHDQNLKSLTGIDLEFGGEYHKLIYDQVLTAQAKKIGKKHGAKVEVGNLDDGRKLRPVTDGKGRWHIMDHQDEYWIDPETNQLMSYSSKEQATDVINKKPTGDKVWSMRLTDKLKQASREGLPYYVALPPLVIGGAAAQQRTEAQRQQSKSDAQQILQAN